VLTALGIYLLQEGCGKPATALEGRISGFLLGIFAWRFLGNCPLPGGRMQARNIALRQSG
jgi:hypothetical protein